MRITYGRCRTTPFYKTVTVILAVFFITTYYRFGDIFRKGIAKIQNGGGDTRRHDYESYWTAYEERIIAGLGHNGDPAQLEGSEVKRGEEALKNLSINTVLSERIPLNRTLDDKRNSLCKTLNYNLNLIASVILIFYNEPLSVILRTMWSVIMQTPNRLLKEIILVDDASSTDLNGLLRYYLDTRLKNYDNIKLITHKQRGGLIRARLSGARAATGDVLVFLDAHCEVTVGWMEPLLQRIQENNKVAVYPVIDTIKKDTLAYHSHGYSYHVGGFKWAGDYIWIKQQNYDDAYKLTPVKSPTMVGGLFAIQRKFFWDIGSYDDQMDGWGGENLEMSFRIWQCGGRVEMVPCSRVGHIFRDRFPYSMPSGKNTYLINTARLADVWMDDYKRLFYFHNPSVKNNPIVGDVTQRKKLRERLQCKSFKWYLENVYPEKFIPDEKVFVYGQFKTNGERCLAHLKLEKKGGPLGIGRCGLFFRMSQFFTLTLKRELRNEDFCAEVSKGEVMLKDCRTDGLGQTWVVYKNGTIYHPATKKCLSAERVARGRGLIVKGCNRSPLQKWTFTYVNDTALVV